MHDSPHQPYNMDNPTSPYADEDHTSHPSTNNPSERSASRHTHVGGGDSSGAPPTLSSTRPNFEAVKPSASPTASPHEPSLSCPQRRLDDAPSHRVVSTPSPTIAATATGGAAAETTANRETTNASFHNSTHEREEPALTVPTTTTAAGDTPAAAPVAVGSSKEISPSPTPMAADGGPLLTSCIPAAASTPEATAVQPSASLADLTTLTAKGNNKRERPPSALDVIVSPRDDRDATCVTQPPSCSRRAMGMPVSEAETAVKARMTDQAYGIGFSEPSHSCSTRQPHEARGGISGSPAPSSFSPRAISNMVGPTFSTDVLHHDDNTDDAATGHHPSAHLRLRKKYENLFIKQPETMEPLHATSTTAGPATGTAAEADAEKIRNAGSNVNSTLMPVFDRAKQVLFTPRPPNGSPSQQLRHSRTASRVDANAFPSTNSPRSALGRQLSNWMTPLLRTPIHRQQGSSINSPLVIDRGVLEEPAQSPTTFGARLKELDEKQQREDNVKEGTHMHMVWQTRTGSLHWTLSPNFVLVSVGDRVCIHWYDPDEEVFETDHTYLNVVPGGRHSCYNTTSSQGGEEAEMLLRQPPEQRQDNLWGTSSQGHEEGMSHCAIRPTVNADMLASRPLLGGGDALARRRSGTASHATPLVVRVTTPEAIPLPEPTGNALPHSNGNPDESAVTPLLGRHRRRASDVFRTHGYDSEEEDAVNETSSNTYNNRPSARGTPRLGGFGFGASRGTPGNTTTTAHSRQPSSTWMLQRSETRQSLGGNCQSFTVSFPSPGEYYFVCSKHKRAMRLHVQVKSKRSIVAWRLVFVVAAAIITIVLVVVIVVVLAYWIQHSTYLFGESDSASYEQYLAFLGIHDLITLKLFPFLATGVLIILLVILAIVGWSVYRCFHPPLQGSHTRGIRTNTRRILGLGTTGLTFALVVLLFVAFGLELNVINGVTNLSYSIGSAVTSNLNMYAAAVLQVNYIVNETSVLFPDVTLPTDEIYSITSQVKTLMAQVITWTGFVEDIAQVAFRVIPIAIYLCMQLGLFAACLTIGALVLNFRKAAVVTSWMLAASLGVFAIVCGIEFAVTKLFSNVYSSVVVLRDDPQDFGGVIGLSNTSFIYQLFSICTITVSDVSVISEFVNEMLSNVNASLDSEGQKKFASVFQFIEEAVPTTVEALANYTGYIAANLDVLQAILDDNGHTVNDLLSTNVVPLLQTVVSVVQTFEGLVNCQVIRDIVAGAIPVFQNQVQNYNIAVFSFLLICFGVCFLLLAFSIGSTYALRHPRKTWCNMRTGRWFRFRYCYKIHIKTLMQGAKAKMEEETVLQWMVHHTAPLMYQLQTVKLLTYSACALMFFDSILIVLFNEVSRGTKTSQMLQALSYLGCAVLFFILLAAVFRRAWVRWVFHTCALICAVGCLGVSVSQAIVGFVFFGQCLDHTRYNLDALTYGSPVYLTCSAGYMGYNLEVAIYAVVIFLNSVTVVVVLALQIRYERNLDASFEHRHYVGVLSPLEKFFPWIGCIFSDYLRVKRVYHGFLIGVTVLFLILFAVLDIGAWTVVKGVSRPTLQGTDIVQVINPRRACNGDADYCNLRANEIIWACAHNAHSSLEDNFVLPNHYYNITRQLQAGIRSFMVDVWYDKINSSASDEEDVYVCHTICLTGRRPWRAVAKEFKDFLDEYPNQVIMILFEQYVNSSSLEQISDDVGLTQYVWYSNQTAPNCNPDYVWPTLQEMIDSGQRAMMYNDVVAASPQSRDSPAWLYYSFDFQFENGFTTTNTSAWKCDIHRGWCTADPVPKNCSSSSSDSSSNSGCGLSSSSSLEDSENEYLRMIDITNCTDFGADLLWKNGSAVYNAAFNTNPSNVRSKMSTMNHFVTAGTGSPVSATVANQMLQIQETTYRCSSTWNALVNIVAFDFWNIANPLGTIEAMNQNIAKNGRKHNFTNQWSRILFDRSQADF